MKKGIRASLYLPKECLDKLIAREKEVVDYFDNGFYCLRSEIGLEERDNEDVCYIDVDILNTSVALTKDDYKRFKTYLKEITGKQPKQTLLINYDKIN